VIRNVHERRLPAPAVEVGALLETLASDHDRLWPRDRWPAMRFDRPLDARTPDDPLRVGACGGHGRIRYQVCAHQPGRSVVFAFTGGLVGEHHFEVEVPGEAGEHQAVLRHVLQATPTGWTRLAWPLVLRPLHDALIEDALDRAELALGGRPAPRSWPLRVRLLRRLLGVRGSRSAMRTDLPREQVRHAA
jgi:hypothetical protein